MSASGDTEQKRWNCYRVWNSLSSCVAVITCSARDAAELVAEDELESGGPAYPLYRVQLVHGDTRMQTFGFDNYGDGTIEETAA